MELSERRYLSGGIRAEVSERRYPSGGSELKGPSGGILAEGSE